MATLDEKIAELTKTIAEHWGYCLRQRRTIEALQGDLKNAEESLGRLELALQTLQQVNQAEEQPKTA